MEEVSKGDAVYVEEYGEEAEGRVLSVNDGEAFLDVFGKPGRTRTVPVEHLVDSPLTENEDWTTDTEETTEETTVQELPKFPSEFDAFDEDDEVKVVDSNDERFVGATGYVMDAEKVNGDWSVMVFLYMPWDRTRDFGVDDLEKL